MAIDHFVRIRRLAIPAGLLCLGVLLVETSSLIRIFFHEIVRFRATDVATIANRSSQLKPWGWKAPLSLVWFVVFLATLAVCLATMWFVAIRRALGKPAKAIQ